MREDTTPLCTFVSCIRSYRAYLGHIQFLNVSINSINRHCDMGSGGLKKKHCLWRVQSTAHYTSAQVSCNNKKLIQAQFFKTITDFQQIYQTMGRRNLYCGKLVSLNLVDLYSIIYRGKLFIRQPVNKCHVTIPSNPPTTSRKKPGQSFLQFEAVHASINYSGYR